MNRRSRMGDADSDEGLSPIQPPLRESEGDKHQIHIAKPDDEVGPTDTPSASPKKPATEKKSSGSAKSPKRRSTEQSTTSGSSPKRSPKKKRDSISAKKMKDDEEDRGGSSHKKEKSPKRKSKSPHKQTTTTASSSTVAAGLPPAPLLDEGSRNATKDTSTPGSSPSDNRKKSASSTTTRNRRGTGNLDNPNNYSSPKFADIDGTSLYLPDSDKVKKEIGGPQLIDDEIDQEDDNKKRQPPSSPKTKKKKKKAVVDGNDNSSKDLSGPDHIVKSERSMTESREGSKSPKRKKKKSVSAASGAASASASMPQTDTGGHNDDRKQKRRSAASRDRDAKSAGRNAAAGAAGAAPVNPGAVAVRGSSPENNSDLSDSDVPPKSKKKKKKKNKDSLELAPATEEGVSIVSSHQQSSGNGPKPVSGSSNVFLHNAASTNIGDVEQGLNGNNDGRDPIEAHLVPDDDTVADRIAERVKTQMEAQYIQQRQEDEARRVTVAAVRVDESETVLNNKNEGEEDDNRDDCCFGLSRWVVIGSLAACLIVVIVVAVTAGVLASKGPEETESPTISPTESPTVDPNKWLDNVGASDRFKDLFAVLDPVINPTSISVPEYLQSEESAQFKAIEWMADVDSVGIPFDDQSRDALVERYALMVLFFNSGQASSSLLELGFNSSSPVCSWHNEDNDFGILCQGPRVNFILLGSTDLQGAIPSEIGLLTSLVGMDFNFNLFDGSLPVELFGLSELSHMWFWNSGLKGGIPKEISGLSSLWSLDLRGNAITGPLPSELGSISGLHEIIVSTNKMTGTIPPELGELPELVRFEIQENLLEGGIPTELGLATYLTSLTLNHNMLIGSVPSQLGNLNALEWLWLHKNDLTGTVPSELTNLGRLTSLGIAYTEITGDVDPIFCDGFQVNPWIEFLADCREPNPEVTCSCCTHCCNNAACVPNSNCEDVATADLVELSTDGVIKSGSTVGVVSTLPAAIGQCSPAQGPTLWYVFETSAASNVGISTCSPNTNFNTVVNVLQASSDGSDEEDCDYICVASNDNHPLSPEAAEGTCDDSEHSFFLFPATAFQTYYIAVSGYGLVDSGTFDLFVGLVEL